MFQFVDIYQLIITILTILNWFKGFVKVIVLLKH